MYMHIDVVILLFKYTWTLNSDFTWGFWNVRNIFTGIGTN